MVAGFLGVVAAVWVMTKSMFLALLLSPFVLVGNILIFVLWFGSLSKLAEFVKSQGNAQWALGLIPTLAFLSTFFPLILVWLIWS